MTMNNSSDNTEGRTDSPASSTPPVDRDADVSAPAGVTPPAASDADGPPRSRKRWIAAAAAALGVALFAVPLLRGPDDYAGEAKDGAAAAGSGRTCATNKGGANFDFTLQGINGADVSLSAYKGKVVLLNFWATWCGPCKVEIPDFVEAYSHYRDRGFVILGVLSQDDPAPQDLREFMSTFRMNYPVFRQNEQFEDAFGSLWALPTSFIIDRNGAICTKHMGPVSRELLDREIRSLL